MLRKTLLTVAVLLLLCGAELLAQSNIDDMEARAYVFRPIVLERTSNLIFGSVTVGDQVLVLWLSLKMVTVQIAEVSGWFKAPTVPPMLQSQLSHTKR
ncbi:hypothetical protein MASR1M107_25200 [Ignavibacteriales bacterium]